MAATDRCVTGPAVQSPRVLAPAVSYPRHVSHLLASPCAVVMESLPVCTSPICHVAQMNFGPIRDLMRPLFSALSESQLGMGAVNRCRLTG